MNLPDSFPKQFILTLAISMEGLMEASMTQWGKILKYTLDNAEVVAAGQIKDFRLRMQIFRHYGVDVGEGFKLDYNYAWVTHEDGAIQLLRLDFLPLSKRALDAEIDFQDGKYEEVEEEGRRYFREVKK